MTIKKIIDQNQDEEKNWKIYFDYPNLVPELWAAKFGHNIGCGDLRQYSFVDKTFQKWIHRLFEILHTPGQISYLRIKLLSDEERRIIEKQIDNGL